MKLIYLFIIAIWLSIAMEGRAGAVLGTTELLQAVNETVFAGTLNDAQVAHAMRWMSYVDDRIRTFLVNGISATMDAALEAYTAWMRGFLALLHDLSSYDASVDNRAKMRATIAHAYIGLLCGNETRLATHPILRWTCNESEVCRLGMGVLVDLERCTEALHAAVDLEEGLERTVEKSGVQE